MDTTSNAMSRTLHLLAQHPDVQEKLRHEVVEARAHGDLDYDQVHALPYLDAVCRETLRLYVSQFSIAGFCYVLLTPFPDMLLLRKHSEGTSPCTLARILSAAY